MENMELGNLKSFNENEINNCSELLCSYFIYQCLLALQHMHSNLIVHRDIKLENILINKNYEVKLADFSMCLQLKENTKYPISRSGTIPYLPPESFYSRIKSKSSSKIKNNNINIIINNNLNHSNKKFLSVESSLKKDTFALGIVMYRLLFKEHPFDYEYKMDRETYGKKIKNSVLSFRGKDEDIYSEKDLDNKLPFIVQDENENEDIENNNNNNSNNNNNTKKTQKIQRDIIEKLIINLFEYHYKEISSEKKVYLGNKILQTKYHIQLFCTKLNINFSKYILLILEQKIYELIEYVEKMMMKKKCIKLKLIQDTIKYILIIINSYIECMKFYQNMLLIQFLGKKENFKLKINHENKNF